MKLFKSLLIALVILLALLLSACSAPSVQRHVGVYKGDFAEGTTITVISGAPHNEGWYSEVKISHPNGTEQQCLMEWGEGSFRVYKWRAIIDLDYQELLYSGNYRYQGPSFDTLIMDFDEYGTYNLAKTNQNPSEDTFDAISPDAKFYDNPKAFKHTVTQIEELKQTVASQSLSYAQFSEKFVVQDMVEDGTYYVVRLTDEQNGYTYVFVDKESLIITDISDNYSQVND